MQKIVAFFIAFGVFKCFAQTEVTPLMLKNIRLQVDKQVPVFRHSLLKKELTATQIEFAVDTFRIERITDKMMAVDGSTAGGNYAVDVRTAAYDSIMNKYYIRLLKLFNVTDKKILINAQRDWLRYRDAEKELIWKMGDTQYSGGGTIQSNIATGRYAYLIVERTKTIFEYYENAVENRR